MPLGLLFAQQGLLCWSGKQGWKLLSALLPSEK